MQGDYSTEAADSNSNTPAHEVLSPFAHVSVAPQAPRARKSRLLWASLAIGTLILSAGAIFVTRAFVSDPYRTLEPFPLETYLGNYHALEGAHFKADLRVENDLGYSPEMGRLMVFSIEGDGRTVAVLIPARLANTVFSRGQRYTAELQVEEGGLIQANRYAKN